MKSAVTDEQTVPLAEGLLITPVVTTKQHPWASFGSTMALVLLLFQTQFASRVASQEKIEWKTGQDVQLQLAQATRVTWNPAVLRDALRKLARSNSVCIFLDPRVDPDQRITFDSGSAGGSSLEQLFERLAAHLEIGYCVIDSVVYLGPRESAARLPALVAWQRESLRALDRNEARRWLTRDTMQWPRLSEPASLVSELLRENDISMDQLESIPHDVWPAGSLPSIPLVDRLAILLVGFDLAWTWEEGASRPRLISIANSATVTRTYRQARAATAELAQLQRMFPESEIDRTGRAIKVTGPLEDHTRIDRLLNGQTNRVVQRTEGEKEYTLENVEAPAGRVVATVAQQLGLTIKHEGDIAAGLAKRVKVNVKNVSIEELLRAALDPVDLTFELTERELIIRSK